MKQAIANGRKFITILSVLSILVVSIFSVFIGVDFTASAVEIPANIEVWKGYNPETSSLVTFKNGSGTATDPYIITNGDELWMMVKNYGNIEGAYASYNSSTNQFIDGNGNPVTPAYYKLANDIYLNDVSNYDLWGKKDFDMSGLNNWHEARDVAVPTFYGKLDGDGYSIYGLYVNSAEKAAFLANIGKDAVVKNLHFRNSYVVNNAEFDPSGIDANGVPFNYEWSIAAKGCASVVVGYCSAGDGDDSTVDVTISNCSVVDAYVESRYFVSGMIGYIDGSIPEIKNCLIARTELDSTVINAEGALLNETWGSENVATVEGVVSMGNPLFSTGYYKCWNGLKVPLVSHKYLFKDCYSDVRHTFNFDHPDLGVLDYVESEINLTKESRVIGEAARENLNIDWDYNWKTVDGDYPIPTNQYIVPTGPEYYANGGPKASEDIWNGTTAKNFAAGTGTVDDPYLIETCEQFYKMVSSLNTKDFYKVADGVEALYFNEVKDYTYEETINYLSTAQRANVYNPGQTNFNGYFDGNGVTIYGVKAVNELVSGLFPKVNTCTLKNFTVEKSYFYAPDDNNSTTTVEGASAVIADMVLGAAANMRNIAVIDCYVNSPTKAAGLVACSHTGGCVFIDDCVVSGGQILADEGSLGTAAFVAGANSGTHVIKNSISLGVYPAADNQQSYGSTFVNVYTDYEAPSSLVAEATPGVTKVETEQLKGKAALETLTGFAWDVSWTIMRDVPKPLKHTAVFGAPGAAWTGNIADAYADGDGSKGNPYQIDTAERLAQMIMYCKPGAYYELTDNITINATADEWTANAKEWYTASDVSPFTGIFNGNGKVISGIYYKDVATGDAAGLFPILGSGAEVRNTIVADSVINVNKGAVAGAIVGSVADNAANTVSLRGCQVRDTVKFSGKGTAGGIVGRVGYTRLRMDNCLFGGTFTKFTGNKAGLAAEIIGKLEVKECISVSAYPLLTNENVKFSALYTDIDSELKLDGVTVLEKDQMIGNNAQTYMTELDFVSTPASWVATEGYPIPTGATKSFDGVRGEAWTGETASNFAGGDGSAADPYLIATGEQLALAVSANQAPDYATTGHLYCNKNYKLIADIKLNDVYDPLWTARVGCQSWFSSNEIKSTFTGHFNGDGYVVYGLYYNNGSAPKYTYVGLFPNIGGQTVIEKVGISHAYIDANKNEPETYAGGIFGMGSAFYDFYGNKTGIAATVNDEFLVPGDTVPTKLPVISQCFVDHNSIIIAGNAGGIGCPGGAVLVMRDCIVTATIEGSARNREGVLIGNAWSGGQRLYNMMALPQNDVQSSGGFQQWIEDEASSVYHQEGVYYYGSKYIYGTIRVARPQWRVGEEAKTAMPNMDWENTWRTEPEGTPVLRVFDKPDRSGSLFSDKSFEISDVQINFITGDTAVEIDPIVGKPYDNVTLPTPSRLGYTFTGWYSFSDITLPYPYDYFLSRDINLYAGWEKNGIVQDFEDYLFSSYDCDLDRWNYNKPGSRDGYDFAYVHSGTKSMQLMKGSDESTDLLLNYEEWLTIGQDYKLTFWVATNEENSDIDLSFVQNNYPDYLGTEVSVEPMITLTGLKVGEWKQYSYDFTANTHWASIRINSNVSMFIDDVVVAINGEKIEDNSTIESFLAGLDGADAAKAMVTNRVTKLENTNNTNAVVGTLDAAKTASPQTSDKVTAAVLIAAIVACAIVVVVSKKSFSEVIDNI